MPILISLLQWVVYLVIGVSFFMFVKINVMFSDVVPWVLGIFNRVLSLVTCTKMVFPFIFPIHLSCLMLTNGIRKSNGVKFASFSLSSLYVKCAIVGM